MHLGVSKAQLRAVWAFNSGFHLWSIKDLRVNARVTYTSETDERKKQGCLTAPGPAIKTYCAVSSPVWILLPFVNYFKIILISRSILSKILDISLDMLNCFWPYLYSCSLWFICKACTLLYMLNGWNKTVYACESDLNVKCVKSLIFP